MASEPARPDLRSGSRMAGSCGSCDCERFAPDGEDARPALLAGSGIGGGAGGGIGGGGGLAAAWVGSGCAGSAGFADAGAAACCSAPLGGGTAGAAAGLPVGAGRSRGVSCESPEPGRGGLEIGSIGQSSSWSKPSVAIRSRTGVPGTSAGASTISGPIIISTPCPVTRTVRGRTSPCGQPRRRLVGWPAPAGSMRRAVPGGRSQTPFSFTMAHPPCGAAGSGTISMPSTLNAPTLATHCAA